MLDALILLPPPPPPETGLAPDADESARRAKASLLYADRVTVQTATWRHGPYPPDDRIYMSISTLPGSITELLEAAERNGAVRYWPPFSEPRPDRMSALHEVLRIFGADPTAGRKYEFVELADLLPRHCLPVFESIEHVSATTESIPNFRASERAEALLATRLLGDLPAFPDAELDAVLDVRDRLSDARTRFRGTMARAVSQFSEIPPEDFDQEILRFRREHVDEALLAIQERLRELGAVPTLTRTLKSSKVVATGMAMGVAAAALSPGAMLAAGTSGGAITALAEEWSERRSLHAALRQMPYWYLHEVNRQLVRQA